MIIKTDIVTLIKVADGYVDERKADAKVWWHSVTGPEKVKVSEHRNNIDEFPHIYSIQKPEYTTATVYTYRPFDD